MSDAVDFGIYRFAIAAGQSGVGWHAVDLEVAGTHIGASAPEGRNSFDFNMFSVCGVRAQIVPRLGPFTHDSRWLHQLRCERCSWVVALNRGAVEQEIDLYIADSGGHGGYSNLLRDIFTAILADALPGPDAVAGHRSDLLAHAARHRPVMAADACDGGHAAAGPEVGVSCRECSFTAGAWARDLEGVTTGECVVPSPCAALTALADHYEIPLYEADI